MKLELDREKGLELFAKLIRTKNVENLQGDQPKTGPEPLHPANSKQKLQVRAITMWVMIVITSLILEPYILDPSLMPLSVYFIFKII